jgi:hypothetical protein
MIALPIEDDFVRLQHSFAQAIFFDDTAIPATVRAATGLASTSRFGVYRNNVIASLTNAVGARYPVVRKLLWDDVFNHVAKLYVTTEPPRSPVMLGYGESFPRFLRKIGEGVAVDYVADIAELEAARTRAYHAEDAVPVGHDSFARLTSDQLTNMRIKLHPSVTVLKSRFPIVSVWEANLYAIDNTLDAWKAESALIARPSLHVEVRRLSPGEYEFFDALSAGQTVDSAVARVMIQAPDFDLAGCFATLLSAQVVIGLEPAKSPSDACN